MASTIDNSIPRVTRADLASRVAVRLGLSRKNAERAVAATFDVLAGALVRDEVVVINGFGSFTPRNRKGYVGASPLTGEEMTVPESRAITFKMGRPMKLAMNGSAK